MDAVDRPTARRALEALARLRERVDEEHVELVRDLADDLRVLREALVVEVGRRHACDVLVRDRRDEDDSRRGLAVERLRAQPVHVGAQRGPKTLDPLVPGERFVEAEAREDHVGALVAQVLPDVGEVRGARLEIGRVGRPREVAHDEIERGVSRVEERLEVPEVLLALEEEIPDERDAVPLHEPQRRARLDRLRGLGARSGLGVDRVLCQFGIARRARTALAVSLLAVLCLGGRREQDEKHEGQEGEREPEAGFRDVHEACFRKSSRESKNRHSISGKGSDQGSIRGEKDLCSGEAQYLMDGRSPSTHEESHQRNHR